MELPPWLPVEQRVEFKILLFTYKMVNGMAPVYLQDLLDVHRSCRQRSGNMQLRRHNSLQFSTCACNALPRELRVCDSVSSFKKALKTFLFKKAC